MKGDTPIQSKFIQGTDIRNCLTKDSGIKGHLEKYPDFLKNGGKYHIPKNQYEETVKLMAKPPSQLTSSELNTINKIREFEAVNNVSFEDVIEPSVVDYSEVQLGKIADTIENEEVNIDKIDDAERAKYQMQARPSIKQAAKVAVVSAAIEGVMSFGATVYEKFSQGKKLNEFTDEDWKEIFKNTGVGTVRGGARGASIYALTNLTKVGAPAAAAIVTFTFGAMSQTIKFAKGEIDQGEYIDGLQRLAGETTFSAIGAVVGQTVIPIPVVGAIVGSLVSTAVLGSIQKAAGDHLQDAMFLTAVEKAYYGTVNDMLNASEVFEKALCTLDMQQRDFNHKRKIAGQLNDNLDKLLEEI
jgi:hypothetical protein